MFVLSSPGVSVVEMPHSMSYDVRQGASTAALPVLWTEPVSPRDLRWVGRLLCLGSACITLGLVALATFRLVV